jgi:hypothetical protein
MTIRPPVRRCCAALISALTMLLVGCSTGAATAAAPSGLARHYDIAELVKAVSDRQRADQTAKLSLRGEVVGASTVRFTGEGVLRVLSDAVSVKFTQVVTQKGVAPQETGFVVLPDAVYMQLPVRPGDTPKKPWVKVDQGSTDPEARKLAAQAATLTESADPTRALARYADATLISDTADDVIDGDPAVRYTIVVDLARAAALEPDPARKAQLEQQVRGGLARVTSMLWLDGDGHPVRSSVNQELPGIGTLAITGSYRDWGQEVVIEPPQPTQVR